MEKNNSNSKQASQLWFGILLSSLYLKLQDNESLHNRPRERLFLYGWQHRMARGPGYLFLKSPRSIVQTVGRQCICIACKKTSGAIDLKLRMKMHNGSYGLGIISHILVGPLIVVVTMIYRVPGSCWSGADLLSTFVKDVSLYFLKSLLQFIIFSPFSPYIFFYFFDPLFW